MTSTPSPLIARVAAVVDAIDRILDSDARARVARLSLLLTFVLVTAERLLGAFRLGTFAIDLRIYRAAADAALHGQNPWATGVGSLTFAAPPPTLIPYLPSPCCRSSRPSPSMGLSHSLWRSLSCGPWDSRSGGSCSHRSATA